MARRLDGKICSDALRETLKHEVQQWAQTHPLPHCAVVLVGNNPASETYVKNKVKAFESVGMKSSVYRLPETASTQEVIDVIESCNQDPSIHGILVQLPLPKHLPTEMILSHLDYHKDVDGLTVLNQGLIYTDQGLKPCTPQGIMELLAFYQIAVSGKNVVVIGRSELVGRPMAQLLLKADATVTMCHSKSVDISYYTKQADIIIVAVGKPHWLDKRYVSEKSIVIDVGIHRGDQGIIGDVHPEVTEIVTAYSPVPKGVGPMTITQLLYNTFKAAKEQVC